MVAGAAAAGLSRSLPLLLPLAFLLRGFCETENYNNQFKVGLLFGSARPMTQRRAPKNSSRMERGERRKGGKERKAGRREGAKWDRKSDQRGGLTRKLTQ